MLYCRLLAMVELSQAHLDVGDLDTARDVFGQVQMLVDAESFGPDGDGWVARLGTQLALANGAVEDAKGWAERIHDRFWYPISQARIHLAVADRASAISMLDAAVPRCVRHDVVLGLVRAMALTEPKAKATSATTAAQLAASNGLLQTVAAEGPDVCALVEHAAWSLPIGWLDRLRRAATQHATRGGGGHRNDPRIAHEAGTRRPALPRQPAHHPRDRRRTLDIHQHAQIPPEGDLPQARRHLTRRSSIDRATDDRHPHPPTRLVGRRRALDAAQRPAPISFLDTARLRKSRWPTCRTPKAGGRRCVSLNG